LQESEKNGVMCAKPIAARLPRSRRHFVQGVEKSLTRGPGRRAFNGNVQHNLQRVQLKREKKHSGD